MLFMVLLITNMDLTHSTIYLHCKINNNVYCTNYFDLVFTAGIYVLDRLITILVSCIYTLVTSSIGSSKEHAQSSARFGNPRWTS